MPRMNPILIRAIREIRGSSLFAALRGKSDAKNQRSKETKKKWVEGERPSMFSHRGGTDEHR